MTEDDLNLLHEWSWNFRSFATFKQNIENREIDAEQLRAFALHLESFQESEGIDGRFSRLFFDKYCKIIAGPCGCSYLIPDHRRAEVLNPYAFMSLTTALYHTPWVDCSVSEMAHIIESGFQTGFRFNTLRDRLGKGTELSDAFAELFSSPKIKNLAKDPKHE